ncbi:MAG: hypothetical protein V4637_04125, partial [Pseudomonadota bacterium]
RMIKNASLTAETLASVLEQSVDCVKLVNLAGDIVWMNPNGMCAMDIDDFSAVEGAAWASLWPADTRGSVRAAIAVLFCVTPLVLGFFLPSAILLKLALTAGDAQFGVRYIELTFNTVLLGGLTAGLAIALALLVAYAGRSTRSTAVRIANRVAGMGYAIPGAVIAVGVLIPVTRLDHVLAGWIKMLTGLSPGLMLTGTVAALVYAYIVRFFAVALHPIEAGLTRITPSMDSAARSLGFGPGATLVRVHAPLLWGSVLSASLLVMVDVMKELPATFVMRPFNFDTLAVQAYNLASDERLSEAATPALTIIAVGLIPLIVLSRMMLKRPARESGF